MTALEILKGQQQINETLLEESVYDNIRSDVMLSLKVRQLVKTKRLEQVSKRINKTQAKLGEVEE